MQENNQISRNYSTGTRTTNNFLVLSENVTIRQIRLKKTTRYLCFRGRFCMQCADYDVDVIVCKIHIMFFFIHLTKYSQSAFSLSKTSFSLGSIKCLLSDLQTSPGVRRSSGTINYIIKRADFIIITEAFHEQKYPTSLIFSPIYSSLFYKSYYYYIFYLPILLYLNICLIVCRFIRDHNVIILPF